MLNQGQGQGQATSAPGGVQPPLLEAPEGGNPAGNYAPTQNRNPVDLGNWADNRGTTTAPVGNTGTNYDPNQGFATGTAPSNAGQQPGVTIPRGSDWQGQGNSGGTPVNSHTIPQVGGTTVSPAPVSVTPQNPPLTGDNSYPPPLTIGNASNDMPPFGGGGNSGGNTSFNQSYGESDLGGSGRTVLNFMAWIVAAGAVAGNLFQWGSIVALRNKYRVALRRNSPGFGRSMAA